MTAPDAHTNFAYSTIAVAPTIPDVSGGCTVQSGDGARYATPPFNAIVCPAGQQPTPANAEIVRVTGVTGDALSFTRQQEGTSARYMAVGDQIFAGPTVKTFTDIELALTRTDQTVLQKGIVTAAHGALTRDSSSQVTMAAISPLWLPNLSGVLVPVTFAQTVFSGIPATVTNPRFDQIAVNVDGQITRAQGIESAGATLANRFGALSLGGSDTISLFDILVTTSGVLAANIRDRRPWARGAYNLITRSAAGAGSGYTSPINTPAAIDATNLTMRMECSGVPLRLKLQGVIDSPDGSTCNIAFYADGSVIPGSATEFSNSKAATGVYLPLTYIWEYTPSAGSRLLQPFWWYTGANSSLLLANSTNALEFSVEEIVRQNANNGTA